MKRVHNFQREVRRTATSSVNNLQDLDLQMSGTLSIDTRSPIFRDTARDQRGHDNVTDNRLQLQLSQSNSNSTFQGSDSTTPIIIDLPSTSNTPQIQTSNPSPALPIFHTNMNHRNGNGRFW